MRRPFSGGVQRLFVIDPERARRVSVQDHGFHFAEIDARPDEGAGALKRRLDVECAIRVFEIDGSPAAGRWRRAEILPTLRAIAADGQVGDVETGLVNDREAPSTLSRGRS